MNSVSSVCSVVIPPDPCAVCGRPCPEDCITCCGLPFCCDDHFEIHALQCHARDGVPCQVCGHEAVAPDFIYCARCASLLEDFDAS
jgi:hypothetical protein